MASYKMVSWASFRKVFSWALVRDSSSFFFALVGAVLGCLGYWNSNNGLAATRDVEVARLISEAWDLMGGESGVKTISVPVETTLSSARNYTIAKRKIDEALRVDGRSVEALNVLGIYWLAHGDLDNARVVLERALTLDSGYADLFNSLGSLHYELGDYQAARDYFEGALFRENSHTGALYNLAIISWQENRIPDARSFFQAAHQSDPVDRAILASYAKFEASQQSLEIARDLLVQAIKLEPGNSDLLAQLGLYLYLNDEVSAAIDALWRAIELDPLQPRSHERIANCLRKLGVVEEAREHFQVAAAIRNSTPLSRLVWSIPQYPDSQARQDQPLRDSVGR